MGAALPASALDVPLVAQGRSFNVHVPASYDEAESMPAVVLLHGYSGTGDWAEAYMRFEPLSEKRGFLYLHPDGLFDCLEPPRRFWNATDACCNFCSLPIDDVGFLEAVLDELEARFNVDPKRIYFVGHSNGGFMAYRMACEVPDRIAAIVSLAGATWDASQACAAAKPVHVLQIHGTNDDTILYEGGNILFSTYPGALETVEMWADSNGCALTPDTSSPNRDLDGSIGGAETSVLRFENGCREGGSAELWSISGGGHNPVLSATFSNQVIDYLFEHTTESGKAGVRLPGLSGSLRLGGAILIGGFGVFPLLVSPRMGRKRRCGFW